MSADEPTQSVLPEHDPMRLLSPEARDLLAASIFVRGARRAPVQAEGVSESHAELTGEVYKPGGTVAWAEHEEAWRAYHQRWRSQDAETIARRGGFGYREMTALLGHEPTTWRAGR